MTWFEILIVVIIGLLIGGLISYVLFFPLYEAFVGFKDVYTKECYEINKCWSNIIDTQKTLKETLKIQEDTVNKIKETIENIK